MKLRTGLPLLAAAGLAVLTALPASQADEPPRPEPPAKPVDVGSLPEVQDVVFFTEKRPLLMRVHVFVDGMPAGDRWEAFQKKLFDYLDVDGDGFLSKEAAKRIPSPAALQTLFTADRFGNLGVPGQPDVAPPFENIDTDNDGKISPAELAAYYRRSSAGPFGAVTAPGRGNTADRLTNALFAALDTNKDGKLSKEELAVADKILLKFDDNDDEMITPQELLATAANPFGNIQQQIQLGRLAVSSPPEANILLVPKEEGKNRVSQRLKLAKDMLTKYDKDKNDKLSREEIGLPKELFKALDRNKDGELDVFELLRWVVSAPDAECTVRLGRAEDNQKLIEPLGDGKPIHGLKLAPTSPTTLALALNGSEVSVVRGNEVPAGARQQLAFYQQQFKALDAEGRGFVTLKQLDNNRQGVFLRPIFALADRNGDGKLTEKELEGYVDLATAAAGCQTTIAFSDNGQGLFDLLDSNGDGRLSIREMRNAWNRLAIHDHEGSGQITMVELPRQYELVVSQGRNQNFQGRLPAMPVRGMAPPQPRGGPSQRGPLWFRKMDVNGDGDVSEREFLGSKEDFRRIDLDGDGLISVEEAEKADAWFRAKLPK